MYSFPSTSQMCDPSARFTKKGSPPTFLKARTGEFTPPGMNLRASVKSSCERLVFMAADCSMGGAEGTKNHDEALCFQSPLARRRSDLPVALESPGDAPWTPV